MSIANMSETVRLRSKLGICERSGTISKTDRSRSKLEFASIANMSETERSLYKVDIEEIYAYVVQCFAFFSYHLVCS
jgi:hypothetical protein